jgi:predicted Rossmann-fold nucleotide-binding protein
MATVADAAQTAGGEVIGVIPQSLVEREVAHTGLDDLRDRLH